MESVRYISIALCCIVLTYGCSSRTTETADQEEKELSNQDLSNQVISQNQNWKQLFNEDMDSLSEIYFKSAVNINEVGEVQTGPDEIAGMYERAKAGWKGIDTIYTVLNVQADIAQRYEYEIGTFITANGDEYHHLIVWNTQTALKTRELEFLAKAGDEKPNINNEIDLFRDKWIQLCNEHNARILVEEVYTENAFYYNHRPLIVGTEAITKEYTYMNNQDYSLNLEPIVVKPITNELAFEIGQCSGSYNGKYILVWQKNGQGEWKVLLDSNI